MCMPLYWVGHRRACRHFSSGGSTAKKSCKGDEEDELEKIAKLHPLLRRRNFRPLTAEQVVESGKAFSS